MVNNNFKFKTAETVDEINLCYKLREIIFIKEQKVPPTRERDDEDVSALHFLLFDNDTPIGVARIVSEENKAIIGRLGILKEYRKNGAGAFLMTEIINFCKKRGFHKIVLGAQEHALNFYKKLGFEIISERYMDANIPHFKMQFSPSPLAGEGIFRCEKRASEKLGEGRTPLHRLSIDEEGGATSESFLTPHLNF